MIVHGIWSICILSLFQMFASSMEIKKSRNDMYAFYRLYQRLTEKCWFTTLDQTPLKRSK